MSEFWTRRWLYASKNTPVDLAVSRQELARKGITNYSEWVVFAVDMYDFPPQQPPPPPAPGHNFAPRTHQSVINLFFSVAPRHPGTGSGWDWIVRAGLQYIGDNRSLVYSGPDIEKLILSNEQKAALIAAL